MFLFAILKTVNPHEMILCIHGKDRYRSLAKLQSIRQMADSKGAKYIEYDFGEGDYALKPELALRKLSQDVATNSLFQEKRFIVVKSLAEISKDQHKYIKEYISKLPVHSDSILMFFEQGKLAKAHALYKAVEKLGAKIDEFPALTGQKLSAFIQKELHQYGSSADGGAVQAILDQTGPDSFAIANMVNLLVNFYPDEPILSRTQVDAVYHQEPEQKIFGLSEYLLTKKYSQFLKLLRYQERIGEEGIRTFGFIVSQVRKAVMIQDLSLRGQKPDSVLDGNSYGIQILDRQTKTWSPTDLRQLYRDMAEIDHSIKYEGLNAYEALRGYVERKMV